MNMSYYPQGTPGTPTHIPYPYHYAAAAAAAAAGYPATPGAAYPYPPGYPTGVTSYTWPYSYAYAAAQHQRNINIAAQRPTGQVAQVPTASTTTQPQTQQTRFSAYTPVHTQAQASQARDSSTVHAAATGGAVGASRPKRAANYKGLFAKELKNLMYGFGDDRNPANDTVNVMEEILVEFILDVCQSAGDQNKRTRLTIEDLRRALSRPADAKKLARMEELLFMQEDIKRARAEFPDEKEF